MSLDLVLKHQGVFQNMKLASDDPSEFNILSVQRFIKNMAENERWRGRGDILWPLILGSPLWLLWLAGLTHLLR